MCIRSVPKYIQKLAGSSTMIRLEILAHRMSSNKDCTATPFATLEAFYCHAKTFQNTYHCHAKHLLLPRLLPHWNPFTATQNLLKTHPLPRPCHTRSPLMPRCSRSVPHYCHTINNNNNNNNNNKQPNKNSKE